MDDCLALFSGFVKRLPGVCNQPVQLRDEKRAAAQGDRVPGLSAVKPEARLSALPGGRVKPCPYPIGPVIPACRRYRLSHLDPANSAQVLLENVPLHFSLETRIKVLQIASAALPVERAERLRTLRGGVKDLEGLRLGITPALLDQAAHRLLSRKSPLDKEHAPLRTRQSTSPLHEFLNDHGQGIAATHVVCPLPGRTPPFRSSVTSAPVGLI